MTIRNIAVWFIRCSLIIAAIVAGFADKDELATTLGVCILMSFVILDTDDEW